MIKPLAVVATFVALNTGGFFVYRAIHSVDAASSSPTASEPTIARPAPAIQPKPTETAPPQRVEVPREDSLDSIVSEPTPVLEANPAVKHAPQRRPRRAAPAPTTKPVSQETSNPKHENKSENKTLLEMDANPYKRGE